MSTLETPTNVKKSRRRRGVIERTLSEISHTFEQSLFAEEIARRPGMLQALDPRIKVVSILLLLIAVGLSRSLLVILGLYLVTVVLAWRSRVPLGFFIKRVWLLMPFFTGIIAIPALFITPGPPLVEITPGLVITRTGAQTALFLLLRVSTSVSLTLLLILTTPWNAVLSALSVMRVPDVMILILGMTYRYIYLLLHITNDMFLSRQSRVVGRLDTAEERRILGATAATLLGKSLDMSSEVYLAMQSRGYSGTVKVLRPFKMQARDWAWGLALIALAVAASAVGQ
jgi:cobalt/nickel transport system permease protein